MLDETKINHRQKKNRFLNLFSFCTLMPLKFFTTVVSTYFILLSLHYCKYTTSHIMHR